MKKTIQKLTAGIVAAVAMMVVSTAAHADVTVGIDARDVNIGFMNVFNLDRSGPLPAASDYQFGSGWGFNDLNANYDNGAGTLTFTPNSVGDPDPYWYIGGGGPGALGNKWMDANGFAQVSGEGGAVGALSGMNVTFEGNVLSNTFTANHTATAFIRDFAPDFSSFNETSVALTTGAFSITLATDGGVDRHVQYGINIQGENVWATDLAPFGSVVLGAAIPEPSSLAVLGVAALGFVTRRRR